MYIHETNQIGRTMVPSKTTISNTNPGLLSLHHRAAESGLLEGGAPHTQTTGRSCDVLWTAMQQFCVGKCTHSWSKTQSTIGLASLRPYVRKANQKLDC